MKSGANSEEIHKVLTEKYFNTKNFARLNERIENLKMGKIYIDPKQDH